MRQIDETEEFREWLQEPETKAFRKYLEGCLEEMGSYRAAGALGKSDDEITKEVRDRASRHAVLSDIIEILEEENDIGD